MKVTMEELDKKTPVSQEVVAEVAELVKLAVPLLVVSEGKVEMELPPI